jgi:ubiquinone/menaquinone biosynthesis C-methylase UbiE
VRVNGGPERPARAPTSGTPGAPGTSADAALGRWHAKQLHYQDEGVVARYDAERFSGVHSSRATQRKWNAVVRALGDELARCTSFLDVPCGTGRFTARLAAAGKTFVCADLSHEMLAAATRAAEGTRGYAGAVRCDAARLPFADASFDAVLCVRFLFHVPRELRPGVLAELARVSRRRVIVDVRHRYAWTTWSKRVRARLAGRRSPHRYSLRELEHDFAAAGLRIVRRVWLAPGFSEKMVVAAERATPRASR